MPSTAQILSTVRIVATSTTIIQHTLSKLTYSSLSLEVQLEATSTVAQYSVKINNFKIVALSAVKSTLSDSHS
ncbi:hypothetical protein HanPI659440_Chr11g0405581 [Helianthus annuus]|nr:hypothetical protein HanPI659440_Chr11g0405581 [Helianthus annuus]